MASSFTSEFSFGDRVILDGDESMVATIIAFNFRSQFAQIEVAWIHNGEHKTAYIDARRLSVKEGK